ncbi:MAG: peptidoglycan-binding domain-containing protein [Demequina sp.]
MTRIAYQPTSEATLYRDLCRGDTGPDVKTLQRLLKRLTLLEGRVDGRFGAATEKGVQRLNARIHVGRSDTCFHVATVTPIPPGHPIVQSIGLEPGWTGTIGEDWVTWAPEVSGVLIQAEDASRLPDGDYSLRVNGHVFDVRLDAGEFTALHPEDFAVLGLSQDGSPLTGALESAEPVDVQILPASAVVVADDGKACLMLRSQEGGVPKFVEIVPFPLGLAEQVAIAPREDLEGRDALIPTSASPTVRTCH